MTTLRVYQNLTVESLLADLMAGTSPLASLPCGAGKSIILAAVAGSLIERGVKPVFIFARSMEILAQNLEAFSSMFPTASIGIACAGLEKKLGIRRATFNEDVVFASPSTFVRVGKTAIPEIAVSLIDEADQASADDATQYAQIIAISKRVAGVTGTPYRLDSGDNVPIVGEGQIFNRLSFEISPHELATHGYYIKATNIGERISFCGMDRDKMATAANGDLNDRIQACNPKMVRSVCEHTAQALRLIGEKTPFLIGATSKKHAALLLDGCKRVGLNVETIDGETCLEDRSDIVDKFKAGQIQGLIVIGVLTRGFNFPALGLIVLAYATKSRTRYVQFVCRACRPYDGKETYYILDFGGNLTEFGSPDMSAAEAIAHDKAKAEKRLIRSLQLAEMETAAQEERYRQSQRRAMLLRFPHGVPIGDGKTAHLIKRIKAFVVTGPNTTYVRVCCDSNNTVNSIHENFFPQNDYRNRCPTIIKALFGGDVEAPTDNSEFADLINSADLFDHAYTPTYLIDRSGKSWVGLDIIRLNNPHAADLPQPSSTEGHEHVF